MGAESRSYCEIQTEKTLHWEVKTETQPETNMKFSKCLQNSTRSDSNADLFSD